MAQHLRELTHRVIPSIQRISQNCISSHRGSDALLWSLMKPFIHLINTLVNHNWKNTLRLNFIFIKRIFIIYNHTHTHMYIFLFTIYMSGTLGVKKNESDPLNLKNTGTSKLPNVGARSCT